MKKFVFLSGRWADVGDYFTSAVNAVRNKNKEAQPLPEIVQCSCGELAGTNVSQMAKSCFNNSRTDRPRRSNQVQTLLKVINWRRFEVNGSKVILGQGHQAA